MKVTLTAQAGRPSGAATPQEFSAWLQELRRGGEASHDLDNATFGREMIYRIN